MATAMAVISVPMALGLIAILGPFWSPLLRGIGVVLGFSAATLVAITENLPPSIVEIGDLRTFRDLSMTLAQGETA